MLVNSGLRDMQASNELAKKLMTYFSGGGVNLTDLGIRNVKTISGNNYAHVTYFDDGSFADIQKRTYYFEYGNPYENKCPMITVDINGYYKKPNQLGVDMFVFRPTKNGKVIPMGNPENASDAANGSYRLTECSKNGTSSANGMGCAYWALLDINPDDTSLTYWKDFLK